jgi:hypothetical protein
MSKDQQVSNVSRREFLVGASSAFASGRLIIGKPPAVDSDVAHCSAPGSTKHEIRISVTPGQSAPTYTDPATGADASLSYAEPGDTVVWRAHTGNAKHHLAVIFAGETPFVDKDCDPVYAFHGGDDEEGNGTGLKASVASTVSDGDVFEYFVGVWDEHDGTKTRSWGDDPTIMIGKGGPHLEIRTAIGKLTAADRLLRRAATDYPPESDEIKGIEKQVEDLIQKLRVLLQKSPTSK